MNARLVHAVLAAGVDNPELIARWRADPGLLVALGVDPQAVDLDGLWKFAGLTLKVRHNPVREALPATFRLMSVAGIEIDVFAAYAADRRRLANTTEERTRDLLEFLDRWLDRDRPEHALLWDLARHERTLATLPVRVPIAARSRVPRLVGAMTLHELGCDPREVAGALWERAPLAELVALRRETYLCYWRPADADDARIVELDAFGFYALALVDGVRTTAALHRALGGTGRPTRGFLALLERLATAGLIDL
jgi:hypothetical protein